MADGHAEGAVVAGWGGGSEPYAVKSKKLGMWLFILSDSLTFSAMLVAYSYSRMSNKNWPTPFEFGAMLNATVMTFVLLSSSVTMVLAVSAAQRGLRSAASKWIGATMLGGLAFVVLHSREWINLFEEGVTPFANPWGVPLFGASFFTLTGLHMLHVTTGVVYLGIVAGGFARGKFEPLDVEVAGLYWHFVDLVWMFIFPLVYLMSNKMI